MKLTTIRQEKDAYILTRGDGSSISLAFIEPGTICLFFCLVVALVAYVMGQANALELVKIQMALAENGIYNPATQTYEKCHAEFTAQRTVIWKCIGYNQKEMPKYAV